MGRRREPRAQGAARPGRRLISARGVGGLGRALPAGIGAKLAANDKRVLCLTGDGAFGFVFQELETAARYGLGVVVVVLNNSTVAYQKHAEQLHYGRSFETELLDVDYAALARVPRGDGISVSDPDQLAPALGAVIASGRPTVVNVVIDPDAFPPITAFDQLRAGAPVPVATERSPHERTSTDGSHPAPRRTPRPHHAVQRGRRVDEDAFVCPR